MPWHHVACCVARDDHAERVLALARRVAAESGARLSLVHGAPRPVLVQRGERGWVPREDDPSRAAANWLAARARDTGAEAVLLTGTTPTAVVEWAGGAAAPDLLVVGGSRTPLARVTSGGFAAHLAYHAPCHVLVVRPAPAEEEQ